MLEKFPWIHLSFFIFFFSFPSFFRTGRSSRWALAEALSARQPLGDVSEFFGKWAHRFGRPEDSTLFRYFQPSAYIIHLAIENVNEQPQIGSAAKTEQQQ